MFHRHLFSLFFHLHRDNRFMFQFRVFSFPMIGDESEEVPSKKDFSGSLQFVRSALPFESSPEEFLGGDEARSTGSLHPNLDRRRSDVSATARKSGGRPASIFEHRIFYTAAAAIVCSAKAKFTFQNVGFYLRRSAGTDYRTGRRREEVTPSEWRNWKSSSPSSSEFLHPRGFLLPPPPPPHVYRRAVYI